MAKLSELCLHNASSLKTALQYCKRHEIGAFRISNGLLPLRTHPEVGYQIDDLPDARAIRSVLGDCRAFAKRDNIRTTFHPDQFIVLNSQRPEVVERSIEELEHSGEMAELVGADVINIHAGGVFGDQEAALERLAAGLGRLSPRVRKRLTLENDDVSYTPADLLPLCWREQIPMIYDIHHHRCLPDGASVAETTEMALSTWDREPVFHLSSPRDGWAGRMLRCHHDFVDPDDFPEEWRHLDIMIEVEAKAKELAVGRFMRYLQDSHALSRRRVS